MATDPISILLFTNTTVRYGVEEHILQLLHNLDRRFFRLHLACPAELGELLKADLPADVEFSPVEIEGITDYAGARGLFRILREQHIQILHSHMFQSSMFASPIAWLAGVPVVLETAHVREVWRKGIKANYVVDRLAGRFVNRYISVSHAVARYLVEMKGLPERKIQVIHNGVDLKKFEPSVSAPTGMKKALGIAESDPVLLVVGRLEPQKGHHVLLEAMPKIVRAVPDAKLICLGDGALRGKLTEMTERLSLQNAVRFVGFQSNVRDWLAMADISVLPSFYEGLPLSAIESLAAARPMVATAVDGTPEVVIHEKTGLTVAPGDSSAMAEAICRLLRDPVWAKQLAQAGREYVISEFSLEGFAQKTQEFYLESLRMALPRVHAGVEQQEAQTQPDEAEAGETDEVSDRGALSGTSRGIGFGPGRMRRVASSAARSGETGNPN
ncbi:MAG TPA: glycosyltransferase family 4 protein [Candidatus Acidoferrales bacterium]|nr:glycosyltransferase family 4 protein [Candidatus Acidoferrales bacterium]